MREMRNHLKCPWCNKGETLSDGRGKVTISVRCEKCHNFYIADLDLITTMRGNSVKRIGRRR